MKKICLLMVLAACVVSVLPGCTTLDMTGDERSARVKLADEMDRRMFLEDLDRMLLRTNPSAMTDRPTRLGLGGY